ncbi:hypothetical protein SRHO_G00038760 [Serrasalmus rhombeus]
MFGRKPQLPIDALLGVAEEEMVEGMVGDWVQEQQEFLRFAYASAQRQLTAATMRQVPTSLKGIAPVLPYGAIVYRRNHFQGRNKIQDIWDSTPYEVVKCLDGGGRVYTIRQVDGLGPTRNLHRSELRVVPGQVIYPVASRREHSNHRNVTEPAGAVCVREAHIHTGRVGGFLNQQCGVADILTLPPNQFSPHGLQTLHFLGAAVLQLFQEMEAKLRVIIEDRIEKLVLLSGIPHTVEELQAVVKETFGISYDFSLQYLDSEFEDYFTLNKCDQIKHKDTIKSRLRQMQSHLETGTFSGYYGLQQSIKYKMVNYHTKLQGFGVPEVICNAVKHKRFADQKSAKNIKKPRKAEVNYLPPYPAGEDKESQEHERIELLTEVKKRDNDKLIKEKMAKTFAHRRHEIINQTPSIEDIKARWPALFKASHLQDEFHRITTVHLESKFMSKLDEYTPKLLVLFHSKGGALGWRLQVILLKAPRHPCINMTREVVIRCLMVYLGESTDQLLKEYEDADGECVTGPCSTKDENLQNQDTNIRAYCRLWCCGRRCESSD